MPTARTMTKKRLRAGIRAVSPHLPAGCDIRLGRERQAVVLANIRVSIASDWKDLSQDLRGLGDVSLGPVRYVSHESEKPMRILWELERPMPPEFFAEVKIAAG